jgi:hypothetical protein
MTKQIKERIVEMLRAGIAVNNRKPQNEVGHTDFSGEKGFAWDSLTEWKKYGIEYDANDVDDMLQNV